MTDKQFQKAIDKVSLKLREYHSALAVAEKEYERRYGFNPSNVDDDDWIDPMHVTGYGTTVEAVDASAKTRSE